MRLKTANLLWGLLFIVVGLGIFIQSYTPYNIFFDGWWTFFIIVPAIISMVKNGVKSSNVILLFIGVFILMKQQNLLDYQDFWKLFIPCIFILIGACIIIETVFKKSEHSAEKVHTSKTSFFSSENVNYDNVEFEGTSLSVNFGGFVLNLQRAIINHDVTIECNCIFGGIDIYVPQNVNIKIEGTPIFGGVSNKVNRPHIEGAPTIFIKATCVFGGVDIK